jgi:cytochrome c553
MPRWLLSLSVVGCLAFPAAVRAADTPADLGRQALAVLRARCVECHGRDKGKARLDLSSPEGIARGSRKGAVVHPGKPDESLLWQMVQKGKMPPEEPLPEKERQVLRHWIESGAPGLAAVKVETHWAFRPLTRPPVPDAGRAEGLRTAIDRFIAATLSRKDLTLSAEADRATLVRRVSFDLTGLPPTPAEIDAFLADSSPDAYERMIDRFLASPRYGERWGKFWLDAAGYADSNGYFNADTDRPLAWRYRDYVIRSFNADKPYDRFVREQLAGDEMAGYRPDGDVTPAMVELLTATHFLRNAPDGTGESDGNPDEVRTDRFTVLEGNLQVAMNCLLGVTIQCARCHDHKFEPITQEEYYRLQAILYPAYCPERWHKPAERTVTVGSRQEREVYQRRSDLVDRQVKALQASLTAVAAPLREELVEERLQPLEPGLRRAVLQALAAAPAARTKEQQDLLKKHVEPLKIGDDEVAKRFREFAAVRESVRKAIAEREKRRPLPLEKLAVLVETDPNPPVHHVLVRGQHNAPGREVQPGVPAAFCSPGNEYRLDPLTPRPPLPPRGEGEKDNKTPGQPPSSLPPLPLVGEGGRGGEGGFVATGRRTAFARWVTSPDNPLFARVMVNRVWQHHFGTGLVTTPDNLGQSGARPSHPELLDWLAAEFIRSGWSIKALHRLILGSAVYRQASTPRPEALAVDPDDRLLWRYPLRRLDAEAVRDAMLAVSGELDDRPGGPYVPTRRNAEGSVEVDEKHPEARRRSVYLQQRRTQVATLLELFDAPRLALNCSVRTTSTVPLQALALLNSDFARARAWAMAARLEREAGADAGRRIVLACRLAWGREPAEKERDAARQFLGAQQTLYAGDKDGGQRAWTDFCQMVLASNAFVYVE